MKEKKKKVIAIITGVAITILLFIIMIFVILNKPNDNKNHKYDIKTEEKNKKEDNDNTDEIIVEKKDIKEFEDAEQKREEIEQPVEKKEEPKNTIPATPSSQSESQTPQPETPTTPDTPSNSVTSPTPTYSCPSGYTLNDTKCSITIDANLVCPPNTTDYSDDSIPRDTYCVNLSEGYDTENGCPSGYGEIKMIIWGGNDKYQCLPLHEKIYACDDGYLLDNNKCIKTIDANKN